MSAKKSGSPAATWIKAANFWEYSLNKDGTHRELPIEITDEENALVAEMNRISTAWHKKYCTAPHPNCRDKGGWLQKHPYTERELERLREKGLRV